MSAVRIIRRRAYVSAHPPQFDRRDFVATALGLVKAQPRVTYHEWCIKHGIRRSA